MPNNDYANEPNQSRSEDIIQSILDNTEYDEPARSRIEYLLVELKNAIEGGGGGGGVTSYAPLTEKPKIDNHTLQAGNNTSSDLGLQTKLAFDSAPTESSTNPVTSGGVYTALGAKANSADVYNKSAVDTALSAKADKSTTYTKTEVDTALGSKQNTISDLSTIRSGAALGATAVQPVSGKGLSTNDYTTTEKEKLAGIEAQANKTTVDSALSGTSTNPVQNKVVKSALDGKQASLTTAQLAAVNSGITAEKLAQDENNISYNTNNGVKNLFNLTKVSGTYSAVVFTVNSDKTVTVNGTASPANSVFNLDDWTCTKAGTYVVSGAPSGGSWAPSPNTYRIRVAVNGTWKGDDVGNGFALTLTVGDVINLQINTSTSYTANNLIFKPMICLKSIYDADPTYQLYALSNAELTAKEQVNENNISLLNQYAGGKNKFNIDSATINPSDASYTKNSDGTINVTKSTNTVGQVAMTQVFLGETGTYIISGCPIGGSSTTYEMLIQSGNTVLARDYGGGASVSLTKGTEYQFKVVVRESQTLSNKLFKPMISVEGGDYQPYALSNAELTAKEQVNENNISLLTTWETYNCLNSAVDYIDLQNSNLTVKVNRGLHKVVISASLKFSSAYTSNDPARPVGKINNIPNYNTILPTYAVSEYLIDSSYTFLLSKNNLNEVIAMGLRSGSLAADDVVALQFEYSY